MAPPAAETKTKTAARRRCRIIELSTEATPENRPRQVDAGGATCLAAWVGRLVSLPCLTRARLRHQPLPEGAHSVLGPERGVDVIPLPRQARPPQDTDLETYLAFRGGRAWLGSGITSTP